MRRFSCADRARPRVDEINDTVALDGDVLLRDHLDGFLRDHASEKGGRVGELCRGRAGADGGTQVRWCAELRRRWGCLHLSDGVVERVGQCDAIADDALHFLAETCDGQIQRCLRLALQREQRRQGEMRARLPGTRGERIRCDAIHIHVRHHAGGSAPRTRTHLVLIEHAPLRPPEHLQRMRVLDKQVHERVVDGRTEVTLERVLFLLGARLVEALEVDVVGRVGFHVGQCGREREGVCLGLVGEVFECGEEVEEGGWGLTEGFKGYGWILEQRRDLGGNLTRVRMGHVRMKGSYTLVSAQQRYAWASASSKFSSSDLTFMARMRFLNSCRSAGVWGGCPLC